MTGYGMPEAVVGHQFGMAAQVAGFDGSPGMAGAGGYGMQGTDQGHHHQSQWLNQQVSTSHDGDQALGSPLSRCLRNSSGLWPVVVGIPMPLMYVINASSPNAKS
jgi:hypothetical protein